MPGTAREEAERLVAGVLPVAGAPSSQDHARSTGDTVSAGLGALGEIVGRVAGAAFGNEGGSSPGGSGARGSSAGGSNAGGSSAGGTKAGGSSAGGSSVGGSNA